MKPIYDGHSTWYLLEQMQNDNLSEQGKIMLYRRFRELVDYLGIDFEVDFQKATTLVEQTKANGWVQKG